MGDKEEQESETTQALADSAPDMASVFPSSSANKVTSAQEDLPLFRDEPGTGKKAKRRRTSPQDHGILEAAYLKNSKPDKHERAQIVTQVHMGEKEVQIWFQNRRQNDRRRSKPLDPHDLAAHVQPPQSPPISSGETSKSDEDTQVNRISADHHAHPSPSPSVSTSPTTSRPTLQAKDVIDQHSTSGVMSQDETLSVPRSTDVLDTPQSSMEEKMVAHVSGSDTTPQSSSKTEDSSVSGSGRKRDHAEMSGKATGLSEEVPTAPVETVPSKAKEPLKRSSSVRLSMTAEGAVKIRTDLEPTPSPPKERLLAPAGNNKSQSKVRRSISFFEDIGAQKVDQPNKPRQLNAGFGRSRDARTWEFYCDNNGRDALSSHVEAERNGSAQGAINLIRSNSHKSRGFPSPMSPIPSRGNTQLGAAKTKSSKPKMTRAQSSLARLQSSGGDVSTLKHTRKPGGHVRYPSEDSDKENWAPGTRMSENPLRRTQPTNNRRAILQSNEGAVFRDARAQSNTASKLSMAKSNAGGDDLDCIQGLLSLSQGAWR